MCQIKTKLSEYSILVISTVILTQIHQIQTRPNEHFTHEKWQPLSVYTNMLTYKVFDMLSVDGTGFV